jgi:diguanylate cyclase (GGDEF)-like protein
MTGVLNKTEFMRLLQIELAQCNKTGSRIALALLDIDNFKSINDCYGHTEGDRALLALVHAISHTIHRQDVLGRFGGDEFAILFQNMGMESAPYLAAKRVFKAIGDLELEVGSEQVKIQVSMGVAISGIDGSDAQTLFQQADAALYIAKANGKNMLAFS